MTSFKNEFGGPDISHGDIKESYIHGGNETLRVNYPFYSYFLDCLFYKFIL